MMGINPNRLVGQGRNSMIAIESQTLFEISGYFIRHDGPFLRIDSEEFSEAILDILVENKSIVIWENQGSFKLIPTQILQNIQLVYGVSQQLAKEYPRTQRYDNLRVISWEQGITIPPQLLAACEKRHELSNTDTSADPTTESQSDK